MLFFVGVKTNQQNGTKNPTLLPDEQLFVRLHEASWPVLFPLACRKLGDSDEAYDVLQDLFIELWDKREVFPLDNLSIVWLKRRLWFKLLAHFRRQGFKRQHLDNFQHFMEKETLVVQPGESANQMLERDYELIMDAIALTVAQMPERMREVFLLNREQHFTINEIAGHLGLSPNTVRNHLQTAMKRLRKALEAQNLTSPSFVLLWWLVAS